MFIQSSPCARTSATATLTLIELLVVIGIISLFIALLLPTLSRLAPRRPADGRLLHLHQIGVAAAAYEVELPRPPPRRPARGQRGRRTCRGLALLGLRHRAPRRAPSSIPSTNDTPAIRTNADGWPMLDRDRQRRGHPNQRRHDRRLEHRPSAVALLLRLRQRPQARPRNAPGPPTWATAPTTASARSYSGNWAGKGMCLLFTDQHAEFVNSKAVREQSTPTSITTTNTRRNGGHPGEGADEVSRHLGLPVTRNSRLRASLQ